MAELPPCSYCFNIVIDYAELNYGLTSYRGNDKTDVVEHFLKSLFSYGDKIREVLTNGKPIIITKEQELDFQKCNKCYICEKPVVDKARDHDHITYYRLCL
jgi:hypothetical protein